MGHRQCPRNKRLEIELGFAPTFWHGKVRHILSKRQKWEVDSTTSEIPSKKNFARKKTGQNQDELKLNALLRHHVARKQRQPAKTRSCTTSTCKMRSTNYCTSAAVKAQKVITRRERRRSVQERPRTGCSCTCIPEHYPFKQHLLEDTSQKGQKAVFEGPKARPKGLKTKQNHRHGAPPYRCIGGISRAGMKSQGSPSVVVSKNNHAGLTVVWPRALVFRALTLTSNREPELRKKVSMVTKILWKQ